MIKRLPFIAKPESLVSQYLSTHDQARASVAEGSEGKTQSKMSALQGEVGGFSGLTTQTNDGGP